MRALPEVLRSMGRCVRCGYKLDVDAASASCPECGLGAKTTAGQSLDQFAAPTAGQLKPSVGARGVKDMQDGDVTGNGGDPGIVSWGRELRQKEIEAARDKAVRDVNEKYAKLLADAKSQDDIAALEKRKREELRQISARFRDDTKAADESLY